jgi:hypothetical protein
MSSANNYFRNMNSQNNINQSPNNIIHDYDDNLSDDDIPPLIDIHESPEQFIDTFLEMYDEQFINRNYFTSIIDRDRIERYFYILVSEINRQQNEEPTTPINRKFYIATNITEENIKLANIECNICYEPKCNTEFIKLNCNHEFCKECIKNILKTCHMFSDPCCAYCRKQITTITYKNETIQTEFIDLIN